MSDESTADDAKAVWRNQQQEKVEMDLAHFMNRRSQELYASTRTEIVTSSGAAVFFVAHLLLGTGLDYLARLYVNLGNPGP